MQGFNGALCFYTKSDDGRLGLKDIAHRKQNTLLQYTVFVFILFYFILFFIYLRYLQSASRKL